MQEISGDLWKEHAAGAVVAITINGMVARSGKSVLLQACARQASIRYPDLAGTLGSLLIQHGNHVFDLGRRIVSFPVESDPYQNPERKLIEQSCQELIELADYKGWPKIVVPQPGCGGGGLEWKDVQPILQTYFDDRFHVIRKD